MGICAKHCYSLVRCYSSMARSQWYSWSCCCLPSQGKLQSWTCRRLIPDSSPEWCSDCLVFEFPVGVLTLNFLLWTQKRRHLLMKMLLWAIWILVCLRVSQCSKQLKFSLKNINVKSSQTKFNSLFPSLYQQTSSSFNGCNHFNDSQTAFPYYAELFCIAQLSIIKRSTNSKNSCFPFNSFNIYLHWLTSSGLRGALESRQFILSLDGLSGLLTSVFNTPSTLLGLAELAIENTPESAWLAGESLLLVSLGDSVQIENLLINRSLKLNA